MTKAPISGAASIVGSTDGGYVLLGLWEPYEELFRGIEWYTGTVYRETIGKDRARAPRARRGASLRRGHPQDLFTSKKSSKKAPIWPYTRQSS